MTRFVESNEVVEDFGSWEILRTVDRLLGLHATGEGLDDNSSHRC